MNYQDFKARRVAMEMTQIQLAGQLGITESTIQNYENGRSVIPLSMQLAMEALGMRRNKAKDSVLDRVATSARKYAVAINSDDDATAAQIWMMEIEPAIALHTTEFGESWRNLLLETVAEAKRAGSNDYHVATAVRRNIGTLKNIREEQQGRDMVKVSAINAILDAVGHVS